MKTTNDKDITYELDMDALIISIKGDLKPTALRHHVFKIGNALGVCGFLNYRDGMHELLIHAEGESNKMNDFTNQINQLTNEYKLAYAIKPVTFESFTHFKISHLDVSLNNNILINNNNNNSLIPDSTNTLLAESQVTGQEPITTNNKRRKSGFKEHFSFLKHVGLW